MRSRCLFNGRNTKYHKDKNIKICDEWINDYDKFYIDMGERPFGTTLDRIDGNGNYEPSNCRWASHRLQQNNKDSLTKVEHNGVIKTIGEWAFELDLDNKQLSKVYKRHSKYNCTTYEELFYDGSLMSKRAMEKHRCCAVCSTTESIRWKREMCNTCYARARRWSNKTGQDIAGYAELVVEELKNG
jgi:hypothetical protein